MGKKATDLSVLIKGRNIQVKFPRPREALCLKETKNTKHNQERSESVYIRRKGGSRTKEGGQRSCRGKKNHVGFWRRRRNAREGMSTGGAVVAVKEKRSPC